MTTVFVAGSMSLKRLDPQVKERIDNIVASEFEVVVGDADGVDRAVQVHLASLGKSRTTVFCSGSTPRNNVGNWPVRVAQTRHAEGTRAFFTAKDLLMAQAADFGLMVWDAKSTGTLGNVMALLARRKKSVVFVNKAFKTVGNVEQLEALVNGMSEPARRKADEKIGLFDRIGGLKHAQAQMLL